MSITKNQKKSWQNHWLTYAVLAAAFAFVGILLGKFTIGFLLSAILQLLSGIYPALQDEVIEVIVGNFSFLMIIGLLRLYLRKREKNEVKELLFYGKKLEIKELAMGVLVGFVLCCLSVFIALTFGKLQLAFRAVDFVIIVLTLVVALIQASAEEMLFRGYLLNGLRQHYSLGFCILVSSVVFAVTHIMNPGITVIAMMNISLFGVVLSLLTVRTNSLYPAIGIHFMWNYMEEIILGTPNSGIVFPKSVFMIVSEESSLFYHQRFGIEGAIQTPIAWGILLFIIWRQIRKS